MADLTTLANLKERLGISGTSTSAPDAYLENLIDRASTIVERHVGRELGSATYTEYYDGDGTRYMNLRHGPVTSVTSVSCITYDSDGNETATALAVGDYFVRGDETDWHLPGWLEQNGSHWIPGQRNYKVVYVAGYTTFPEDLEQCALHVCVWLKNKREDTATDSRDVGGGTIGGFQSWVDLKADLDAMLAPYLDYRMAK